MFLSLNRRFCVHFAVWHIHHVRKTHRCILHTYDATPCATHLNMTYEKLQFSKLNAFIIVMIFFFALCAGNIDFDYIDSLGCGLAGLRSSDHHFTCSKAINNSKREGLGWTKCIYDVNNKFMSDAFSVHTLIAKHLLGFSSDSHMHTY